VSENWVQLGVSLVRDEEGQAFASAIAMFDALRSLLSHSRQQGMLRSFYFMRKPPDVCLRFEGPDPAIDLLPPARTVLDELRRQGTIAQYVQTVYEPETRKFGGSFAMAAVHEHFDADTGIWLDVQRVERDGTIGNGARVEPAAVMEAMANDLFCRALHDKDEIWDTWFNLAVLAHPGVPRDPGGMVHSSAAVRPAFIDDLTRSATPSVGEVLRRYCSANQRLADALRAEPAAGRPPGLRATLAFVAQYDFHRWGLPGPAQATVAESMIAAWHPARGLRGAT
jgi:thiopeptide-type bacteriocin biosynthesis protein